MKVLSNIKNVFLPHLELVFWGTAICLLFFMNVNQEATSFCVFKYIGFSYCPGCGLGHSIHHALHLQLVQSFNEHWFGIPALFIILFRIKQLFKPTKLPVYES